MTFSPLQPPSETVTPAAPIEFDSLKLNLYIHFVVTLLIRELLIFQKTPTFKHLSASLKEEEVKKPHSQNYTLSKTAEGNVSAKCTSYSAWKTGATVAGFDEAFRNLGAITTDRSLQLFI